ncbi:MAG TPA: response regulator transcription factor [Steroidobacteraceae bacterium]|jgi:DNA-binding CsgD family transcriptional regulator
MPTRNTSDSSAEARPSARLLRGRACYERGEWNDAFESLALEDESRPLGLEDLHRLAWSAGLTARDEPMLAAQERLYHGYLESGRSLAAARASFWIGFRLLARGEAARASGWLTRAHHLVEQHAQDCVEQGYLLLPAAQRHINLRELDQALACAERASAIGERFAERDLIAFARNLRGRALLALGRVEQGLAMLDESMVAAISGELSPIVTGIVYCSSIVSCHRVFALDRVREWTVALSQWCAAHPQLGMFTGHCLVHRAEVMELAGSWAEAVEEARRAVLRCVRDIERDAAGRAHYLQAEIHRVRGEFELAESAYREASRCGFEPQPGLALLRLAQGDVDAAASASRRMIAATRDRVARTRFLPAHVEIMLAHGDIDEARTASRELEEAAANLNTDVLSAIAAHAAGAVNLAAGNAHAVLDPVRRAFGFWQQLGAPYLAARLRVLLARACAALGDVEGARLELECAFEVFERLGARPDLAAVESLMAGLEDAGKGALRKASGLTERELQVLRLIASGKTNKAIARELTLSEKTVDRHVSNIFAKTDVNSRAAATAFAYERKLI